MISDRKRSGRRAMMNMLGMSMALGVDPASWLPSGSRKRAPALPKIYPQEVQAELDRLYADRSSPGRKAYKKYLKEVEAKYDGTTDTNSTMVRAADQSNDHRD
jgi:hypothetical protein